MQGFLFIGGKMIQISNSEKWKTLSFSESGEAIVSCCDDDRLVVCKLNVFASTDQSSVFHAFATRLRAETSFSCIGERIIHCPEFWVIKQLLTDVDSKYLLFAQSTDNDYSKTVAVTFQTVDDYFWFIQEFPDFINSIDFSKIHQEIGELESSEFVVKAFSISDVTLRQKYSGHSLVFTGSNKYFVVSISDKSQRDSLISSLGKNSAMVLSLDVNTKIERYKLTTADDDVIGIVELQTSKVNNKYVEVLGYWMADTDSTIANNIQLKIA